MAHNPRFRSYSILPENLANSNVMISINYMFSLVFQWFGTSLVRRSDIKTWIS
jgi:hypothetical protein